MAVDKSDVVTPGVCNFMGYDPLLDLSRFTLQVFVQENNPHHK